MLGSQNRIDFRDILWSGSPIALIVVFQEKVLFNALGVQHVLQDFQFDRAVASH